jgi:hypothetical protein
VVSNTLKNAENLATKAGKISECEPEEPCKRRPNEPSAKVRLLVKGSASLAD